MPYPIGQGNVFANGEVVEELRVLEAALQPGGGSLLDRHSGHVGTVKQDTTAAGPSNPGDDREQRRLACTVWAY